MADGFKLVLSEEIPQTPQGYTIEAQATLENLQDAIPVSIGVFKPEDKDKLSVALGLMLDATGQKHRDTVADFVNQFCNWPMSYIDGESTNAFLGDMRIFYHDGSGGKWIMDVRPVSVADDSLNEVLIAGTES